jgi:CheY-like chemotaxis protein
MPVAKASLRNGIIVADNDALLRGILRTVLTDARQSVFLAEDGMEAVIYAHRFIARLILLDLAMPRMDGLAACKLIRELPGYADVPIVILTGHDQVGLRAAATTVGATRFLTKPFQVHGFLRALAPYLDLPEDWQGQEGSNAGPPGLRAQTWNRHPEPRPIFGEPPELERGRKMLGIERGRLPTAPR